MQSSKINLQWDFIIASLQPTPRPKFFPNEYYIDSTNGWWIIKNANVRNNIHQYYSNLSKFFKINTTIDVIKIIFNIHIQNYQIKIEI